MTTSDLQTALRRALTTLASSLPSNGGLPPSPIDELSTPEERLADRLVRRLALRPPIDVEKLASSFATITDKSFPSDIDGLCLDLKLPGKRPKIWLSRSLGRVRRRFTLAHEVGHIVIPWHTGSIADELDAPRTVARSRYRQMEAEANRFAAELLMPTSWVRDLAARADHVSAMMHAIVHVADVSFPAALYRVEKLGPPGFVGAVVRDGVVVWSGRTKGTYSLPPPVGTLFESIDMPVAAEPEVISNDETRYYWWQMRHSVGAPDEPGAPWRDILERMLATIPLDHRFRTRQRVNAIVGLAIGKAPRGTPVEDVYRRALEASQNRSDRDRWVANVMGHPEYKDYLLGRAYERQNSS